MTNEKAIEILQNMAPGCGEKVRYPESMNCEAIEIAINALSSYKNEPLTLEQLLALKKRAEKGEQILIYCTPLKDFAKVFKFGIMFFGTEEYRSWSEVEEEYGELWLAYEYPSIDQDKWEPCRDCKSCASCTGSIENPNELPCSQCEHYCNYIPRKYCPECGRPLTDEAWELLEKRIRG